MTKQNEELKRVKIVFAINMAMCVFGFVEFIKALNTDTTWRMIVSGIGFSCFLFLTTAVLFRLIKLQKTM